MLSWLLRDGNIVQFLPRGLDLVNKVQNLVPSLSLRRRVTTPVAEDPRLTLHLFHTVSSCTQTRSLLIDTVQLTLQPDVECKSALEGLVTHPIP